MSRRSLFTLGAMADVRARAALIGCAAVALLTGPAPAQSLLFRIDGKAQADRLAESVACVGDFNHDGYGDFAVGAKFDDTGGDNAGLARVLSGRDGSVLFSATGSNAGDWFGLSVAGAGDVNADGYADLIVGAPGYDAAGTNSGRAYVYSGKTGGTLYRFEAGGSFDHFGQSVAGAGDVNADGHDDVVVGAPQEGNGTVHVYSGKNGAVLWTFSGGTAGDALGHSVAGAGDVNGDGFADIIAGAPWGDTSIVDAGYARVYSGRTGAMLHDFRGGAGDALGWSVDGAGDFNGDGFADVIFGLPTDDPNGTDSGSVQVRSGFDGALLMLAYGLAAGDELGSAVSGAGDVLGTGKQTVMIGAPGEAGGTVRLYDRNGLVYKLAGATEYGAAVDGGADFNKDGLADFIIGDPGRNLAGPDTGRGYAYIGIVAWANRDTYGSGWPGTQGVPDLTASADPLLCSTISLDVENSRGATTAGVLLMGLAATSVPTAIGGTLLVVPYTIVPVVIPKLGLSLPLAVDCDSALAGLAIYLQVLESDPGASQGVSFTPGLQLILGGISPY
ncbi:MAG: integrin alpha [Planctomycetota bacterium]